MALLLSSCINSSASFNLTFSSVKSGKNSCARMAVINNNMSTSKGQNKRKLPILLFDVMDTIVRDPFHQDVPAFFRHMFALGIIDRLPICYDQTITELVECKHPTAWIEFEKGLINEVEMARKFFKDGRPLDIEGLKRTVKNGYSYLEGVQELLRILKTNGYELHAFTNYSIWYHMVEDKLKLSNYLSWTFCSCFFGKRKPEPDLYSQVLKCLDVEPSSCIFIDDRMRNVDAGIQAGFIGLQFKNVDKLRTDLSVLGIDLSAEISSDKVECCNHATISI